MSQDTRPASSKKPNKSPAAKPQSSLAQRDQHRLVALNIANIFGFGNKTLLAKHCFGKSADPNHQAARFLKKLKEDGFVNVIGLDGHGSIYTMTSIGVNLLELNGIEVIAKGKPFGRMELCPNGNKRFLPPLNFYHNQLAATALACLSEKGYRVWSEKQIRHTLAVGEKVDRYDPKLKIPDGIAISLSNQVYLVEVENARKTSADLERLIEAIVSPNSFFNAKYHMEKLLDLDPSFLKQDEIAGTIIVYDPMSISSDLRKLDHHGVIKGKLEDALAYGESTAKLIFCECNVLARNVTSIELHPEEILVGMELWNIYQADKPAPDIPEMDTSSHPVHVQQNLTPTVTIKGFRLSWGQICYEYCIYGMTVCEYDFYDPGCFRGFYSSRQEAFWFAVQAIHHGQKFDLESREVTLDDYFK